MGQLVLTLIPFIVSAIAFFVFKRLIAKWEPTSTWPETAKGLQPAERAQISMSVQLGRPVRDRRLAKVAVIRLSSVYTKQCPPFIDFPKSLRILTEGHVGYVDGGFESTPFPFLVQPLY